MSCCDDANFDPPPPFGVASFEYEVTGAEPDLSELVIALPAVRADTNYRVFSSQGTATYQLAMNVDAASKTVAQFVLSLSGPATAGDVFNFIIAES